MTAVIDDLIVITKHYPFEPLKTPGESFLNNEVRVLSSCVKRIHILCTEVCSARATNIALPPNVHAYAVGGIKTELDKAKCLVEGQCLSAFAPLFVRDERRRLPLSAKLYLNYFWRRGEQKAGRIIAMLRPVDLGKRVAIYSYWCYDHAYAAVRVRDYLKGEHEVRCVSRAHRYDLYEYNRSYGGADYLPLRRWLFNNLDAALPCSKDGTRYLSRRYPDFADKFITSYIGTADYGKQPYEPSGTIRICSCSQLIEVKRIDRLIDVLSLLECNGYEIEWIHFGGGKQYDSLVKKAHQCLKRCVWHMPGSVENPDVLKYYSSHCIDLFVNVSKSEGLPISIMEAASFGIPVIATDVGGTSEIVVDGHNGYLLERDFDNEQFVDTFNRWVCLTLSDKLAMREASRAMWLKSFECKQNARHMARIMEDLFEL